jgi:hypothetical protein
MFFQVLQRMQAISLLMARPST